MKLDDSVTGSLDIGDQKFWSDPYLHFANARRDGWLYKSERGFEVLSYDGVSSLLRNRKLSRDEVGMADRAGIQDPEVLRFRKEFLINIRAPHHVEVKSSVSEFFGKHALEAIRPKVAEIIDVIFREIPDLTNVELLNDVCFRIPSKVYLFLVGEDIHDKEKEEFIANASDRILRIFNEDPKLRESIESTYHEVFKFVDDAISSFSAADDDSNLTARVLQAVEDGKITTQEGFDLLVLTLEASVDNTYTQIVHTLNCLLDHPSQWQALIERKDSLLENALEEGIRYRPRVILQRRSAFDACEILGSEVAAGSDFYLSVLSAHRDPSVFEDPDTFDISRSIDKPTLMFGGGLTACLGSALARLEMQEFFKYIIEHFPNIHRIDVPKFVYEGGTVCAPGPERVSLI